MDGLDRKQNQTRKKIKMKNSHCLIHTDSSTLCAWCGAVRYNT